MNDIYPLVVVLDRYNGTYSGGKWTAWNLNPWGIPLHAVNGDDIECADFFAKNTIVYGRGETPQEAIDDLKMILDCGISDPDEEDEEDKEMKATSVQNIKNVKDICFTIENNPIEQGSKLIIVASTNDDIFAFEFEGQDLLQSCKKAGLFTGWEKDEEIKRKNREINELHQKLHQAKIDNRRLTGRYDGLLKYFHILLAALKTPTIENFSDEKPSDNVNHPSHYTGKYECIDVMRDVFGDEATNDFCLCNAFKYIWRARKKNGLEDVKKAVWYLNKYIEEAEKDGEDEVTGT